MGLSAGIVPLALLSVVLLLGGVFAVVLTRRIARVRMLREMQEAAQAQQEAEHMAQAKPVLVDVYIALPKRDLVCGRGALPWADVLPISTILDKTLSSPHPHRTIERTPGHPENPFIDGNVVEVSVGIAMPRPSSHDDLHIIYPLESFEYCIGTSDAVVCTLLGARPRLLGLN